MKPKLPPPVPYSAPPCSMYNRCSAPCCPLHDLTKSIWYANEQICRKQEFTTVHKFIKTQRKIARRSGQNPDIGYFTYDALCNMGRIYRGIRGANPDRGVSRARRKSRISS